ncbi:radical SAM protein, partial [Verrucomicrobiota bacterium]
MSGGDHNIRGFYVHVPFCDGKCRYCAFYSILYDRRCADQYLAALEQELEMCPDLKPETIYIGGGTPSVLSVRQLERLCALIRRHLCFDEVREWSIEANPGSITRDKLSILVRAGVDRISL